MPFTQSQNNAIQAAIKTSASLSVLGTLSIFYSLYKNPKSRTPINRLVLYMSIQDFFASIFQFFGNWSVTKNDEMPGLCSVQAFSVQWMTLGAICWTAAISINVLILFAKRKHADYLLRYEKWYLTVNYGATFLLAFILLWVDRNKNSVYGMGMYDDAGLWCWIKGDEKGKLARIFAFFLPLWLVFALNTFIYLYVGRLVWVASRRMGNLRIQKKTPWEIYLKKTLMYSLAFVITWTPATINRIQNFFGNPIFVLVLLHSIFTPLQGFLNATVYFFASRILNNNQVGDSRKSAIVESSSPTSRNTRNNGVFVDERGDISGMLRESTDYIVDYVRGSGETPSTIDAVTSTRRNSTAKYAKKEFVVDPALFDIEEESAMDRAPKAAPNGNVNVHTQSLASSNRLSVLRFPMNHANSRISMISASQNRSSLHIKFSRFSSVPQRLSIVVPPPPSQSPANVTIRQSPAVPGDKSLKPALKSPTSKSLSTRSL